MVRPLAFDKELKHSFCLKSLLFFIAFIILSLLCFLYLKLVVTVGILQINGVYHIFINEIFESRGFSGRDQLKLGRQEGLEHLWRVREPQTNWGKRVII